MAGVWAHARRGRKGSLSVLHARVLFAGSAIRPAVESFESVILGVGDDVIQSLDTQLQTRVRSNKKVKNPYFGFAILTMTKSKHPKTDFNAEKSVVGFPFNFSPFFLRGKYRGKGFGNCFQERTAVSPAPANLFFRIFQ